MNLSNYLEGLAKEIYDALKKNYEGREYFKFTPFATYVDEYTRRNGYIRNVKEYARKKIEEMHPTDVELDLTLEVIDIDYRDTIYEKTVTINSWTLKSTNFRKEVDQFVDVISFVGMRYAGIYESVIKDTSCYIENLDEFLKEYGHYIAKEFNTNSGYRIMTDENGKIPLRLSVNENTGEIDCLFPLSSKI